jgi:hypothetical protein
MRKTMFLLAVFGLATSLWAAGPFLVGTFKLNPAKSKDPANMLAKTKEATVTFRELDADTMEATSTTIQKDGSTVTAKWTVPKSGGIQKYQQGGRVLSARLHDLTCLNLLPSAFAPVAVGARRTDDSQPSS